MFTWLKSSIIYKLWLVTSLTAMSLLTLVFLTSWYFTSTQVTEGALDRIEGISATLSQHIDGDSIDMLTTSFQQKDGVVGESGIAEAFSRLTNPLTTAYVSNQLSTPIYTMSLKYQTWQLPFKRPPSASRKCDGVYFNVGRSTFLSTSR